MFKRSEKKKYKYGAATTLIDKIIEEYKTDNFDVLEKEVLIDIREYQNIQTQEDMVIDNIFGVVQYLNNEHFKGKVIIDFNVIQEIKQELMELQLLKERRLNAGRKERFTNADKFKIKELRAKGRTIREIAQIYSCSVGTIHKIISDK